MLGRTTVLSAIAAARLCAADSDFRAGFWEGTIERGNGVENISLSLTVSVQYRAGENALTTPVARLRSGLGTCGANQVEIGPNRVAFDCMTIKAKYGVPSSGGRFEGYFSAGSSLASGTWRGEPIQLTRPKQSDSRSEGEWVAENGEQTCVVRFFDANPPELRVRSGRATIDIYSKAHAVFGKDISLGARVTPWPVGFSWTDTDKNFFRGELEANDNEMTGTWYGNDFLCGGPNHKVTFRRMPSSL